MSTHKDGHKEDNPISRSATVQALYALIVFWCSHGVIHYHIPIFTGAQSKHEEEGGRSIPEILVFIVNNLTSRYILE